MYDSRSSEPGEDAGTGECEDDGVSGCHRHGPPRGTLEGFAAGLVLSAGDEHERGRHRHEIPHAPCARSSRSKIERCSFMGSESGLPAGCWRRRGRSSTCGVVSLGNSQFLRALGHGPRSMSREVPRSGPGSTPRWEPGTRLLRLAPRGEILDVLDPAPHGQVALSISTDSRGRRRSRERGSRARAVPGRRPSRPPPASAHP